MAHDTTNSSMVVMQEVYSTYMIEVLPDLLLPSIFARAITEMSGDTLHIPVLGAVTLQETSEETELTFSQIDQGRVTMQITEQVGDAWSVTDDLKEDSYMVDSLMSGRSSASTVAFAEEYETKYLAACNAAQDVSDANVINGAKHRFVAGGATRHFGLDDFRYLKWAADKAKLPQRGRIGIVDSSVEASLNAMPIASINYNPQFQGLVETGFAENHKFLANIFGWDLYTSNLLPAMTEAETLTSHDGSTFTASVVGDVANIFMCVADDQTVPMMSAMRRVATVSAWRDDAKRCDKYQATSRYGFGAQRTDSLLIVLSNPSFA